MTNICLKLMHGIVVETDVESVTGKYLYSDTAEGKAEKNSRLNQAAQIPFVGIVSGAVRVALGVIHTLGHLLGALLTLKEGHLFHAAKGGCEILRGVIEMIPVIGRLFANTYGASFGVVDDEVGTRSWWMIKIYNPKNPDGLDMWMDRWTHFPASYKYHA